MRANTRLICAGRREPVAERRKSKIKVPSFEEAARIVHCNRASTWKNEKHAAQWLSTLEQYVFPNFGPRRIDAIETPDVLRVLLEIWLKKPETARRVRQRIGTVFDWAKAAGFRTGENPIEGISKGLFFRRRSAGRLWILPHRRP